MGKTIMYERIYADLLAKIQNGDYQPGDRLPSEKESAELYGVSRITAKKAMDMLAKEKKISVIMYILAVLFILKYLLL